MRRGRVYISNQFAGDIEQADESLRFWYTKQWLEREEAEPASLTLPLSEKVYESNILFPFFDGLIPEGYLLDIAIQQFGLKNNDRMGLLLKTCHETIGNVSVFEEEDHE